MVKRLAILALLLCALHAQAIGVRVIRTNDLASVGKSDRVTWHQADSIQVDIWARQNGVAEDYSVSNTFVLWEVAERSLNPELYISTTGTIKEATNGHIRCTLPPDDSNLPAGKRYESLITVYHTTGGTTDQSRVVDWCDINVEWSPAGTNLAYVGPLTNGVIMNPLNVTVQSPTGWPWPTDAEALNIISNAVQDGAGITIEAGANGGIKLSSSAATSKPYNPDYFTWSASPTVSSTNTSSVVTNYDRIEAQTVGLSLSGYLLSPQITRQTATQDLAYTSGDEDVLTVDDNGLVRFVAEGTATVTAALGAWSRTTNLTMSVDGAYTQSMVIAGQTGSWRKVMTDMIDDRLTNVSLSLYSTQDHTATNYVRSTNCWAADIDLTCASPWNSAGANYYAGTLISSQYVVFARHYQIPTGATVRFVDATNHVYERTLTDKRSATNTDLCVGLLDEALPAAIKPAYVLPGNWRRYITTEGSYELPLLSLDAQEHASVRNASSFGDYLSCAYPEQTNRQDYYEPLIGGDSGNPALLVMDTDTVVIVTTWHYGGAGSGPAIDRYTNWIESAMAEMGTNHTALTRSDLSSYYEWANDMEPPTP